MRTGYGGKIPRLRPLAAYRRLLVLSSILLFASGCATLPRNAVPVDKIDSAEIVGMPDIRAWGGQIAEHFQADAVESVLDESRGEFPRDENGVPIYDLLALSGGGSNGAFGAGFLYGWTKAGTRPNFKLVTGISTGALIAPFAFLGSDFDAQLKQLYTTMSTADLVIKQGLLKILFRSESYALTDPLKRLIDRNIDGKILQAVAVAHDRGHRLYIGTTHLDAQRLVIWNMGLIAKTAHPNALELFRKILLASASIPGAMPPVLIEVDVDGEEFDEMHVDGGAATQVFLHAGTMDIEAAARSALGDDYQYQGDLYIIRNGRLKPEPQQTERKLASIAGRAISTMIKTAAVDDLFRMYAYTQREQLGFKYIDIPDDFESRAQEPFDPEEMGRLFETGYQLALSGDVWQTIPPGLASAPDTQ
ncbi:MAG: patatin-like phospholipase family protein [Proteobacteria bacterium]|nr:MAG: patatin-like phospholipase family protein [Pseudomonadota bacterium]